jgi:hypothetical protein
MRHSVYTEKDWDQLPINLFGAGVAFFLIFGYYYLFDGRDPGELRISLVGLGVALFMAYVMDWIKIGRDRSSG